MSTANINNKILAWARERPGVDQNSIFSFSDKYHDWERGVSKPTFAQAKKLAQKLCIPFGFLFLSSPPIETQLAPDLRTLDDSEPNDFSVDLRAVIEDAQRKQDWYKEKIIEEGAEKLSFIGKYNINDNFHDIATEIISTLGISIEDRKNENNLMRFFTDQTEQAGILVLRNGKVGFNTHRVLDVEEFRGFVLSDSYAPLIFINSADVAVAQVFTLMHELAHLWIGQDGVSNFALNDLNNHNKIEKFCNQIAAEVLAPEQEFRKKWQQSNGSLEERCDELQKFFRVSTIVLARRALDLGLILQPEFFAYYEKIQGYWKKKKEERGGGGHFNNTFPIANSTTLTHAVCHAVYSGEMLLRNGARLLGVKPATLNKYAKNLGEMF